MRKLLLAGLVALFAPTASRAQVQLALRAGYAPATGDAFGAKSTGSQKLSDVIASQIPIEFDASYKFDKAWAAGLYVSYGFCQPGSAFKSDTSSSGLSWSADDLRFGVLGSYAFNQVGGPFLPWVALNVGYEQLELSASAPYYESETVGGFEVGLQVGGDYRFAEKSSLGPYVSYSVGKYGSTNTSGLSPAPSIHTTIHGWLGFGLVGKWDL